MAANHSSTRQYQMLNLSVYRCKFTVLWFTKKLASARKNVKVSESRIVTRLKYSSNSADVECSEKCNLKIIFFKGFNIN